jgi:hypothetical protein
MIEYLKKTAILLLLAAFLVPASGMLVFMHHCRAMGTLELSIDGSNSCCTSHQGLFMAPAENLCELASAGDGSCSHKAHFSKQSCCEDDRLFVKIVDNYLSASGFFFQKDITEIELSGLPGSSILTAVSLPLHLLDAPDPPGNDTWLKVSSLRL